MSKRSLTLKEVNNRSKQKSKKCRTTITMELFTKPKNICNILLQEKNRATKAVTDFTINANLSIYSIQFKQKKSYPSMYRGVMIIFVYISSNFNIHIPLFLFLQLFLLWKFEDALRDVKPSIHGKKENARFERTLRILIRKKQLGSGTTKTKMVINKDI